MTHPLWWFIGGAFVQSILSFVAASFDYKLNGSSWVSMVKEFNHTMHFPVPKRSAWKEDGNADTKMEERYKLIDEEVSELREAITDKNMTEYLDALTDIIYVAIGGAVELGLDIDSAFIEVHNSNLSKLDDNGRPTFSENGKLAHGPNYIPPSLEKFL